MVKMELDKYGVVFDSDGWGDIEKPNFLKDGRYFLYNRLQEVVNYLFKLKVDFEVKLN